MVETKEEQEADGMVREKYSLDTPSFKVFHDDLMLLTLAFHDTTAACMTSCLMELARRPELHAPPVAQEPAVGRDAQPQGLAHALVAPALRPVHPRRD